MARPPAANPSLDLPLLDLLAELGFSGNNAAAARQALEEAGLTRPGKQRIAARKREDVAGVLHQRFIVVCARPACQHAAQRDGRALLLAEHHSQCEHCNGSDNRHAVDRLCAALREARIHKLVVVGGSPNAREALRELIGERLQLRTVDGVARRTKAEARADLLWADRVVVWGGTQLDHKVSVLYTDGNDPRVLAVHRRGVAALADEVLHQLRKD